MSTPDPSTPSNAHARMSDGWQLIRDILDGPEAIRNAAARYLPKYASEGDAEYRRRLKCAPWSAEAEDIIRALVAKPFTRPVGLEDGASEAIVAFAANVDRRGAGLTDFARVVFEEGVAKGCCGIFVDHSARRPVRTIAEEKARAERPYWVAITADQILDLRAEFIGGAEVVTHLRFTETAVARDGYTETTVERVREFNRAPIYDANGGEIIGCGPPEWLLWEAKASSSGGKDWEVIASGTLSIGVIPIILFRTGRREGSQYVRPPLLSLADKQIELYRAMSREDEVLTYAGSPMLSAQGVQPPKAGETVEIGPKRVLYAPADGQWSYIQPDAENLRQIREQVEAVRDDLRRLGMQPLTQRSGGVTATATAVEGARAHSALQAWALALRDALTAALALTSRWLGEEPTGKATVHVDFAAGIADQVPLEGLHKARAAGDISRVAYLERCKHFGVLAPDFDVAADEERLAQEARGLEPEPVV